MLCKDDISKFGFGVFLLVVQLLLKNVIDWKERGVLSGSLELGTTVVQ